MKKGPGRQLHFDLPPLDATSPVSVFVLSKRRRYITLSLAEQLTGREPDLFFTLHQVEAQKLGEALIAACEQHSPDDDTDRYAGLVEGVFRCGPPLLEEEVDQPQ